MKTGIELIAEERQRQIEVEGWTKDHDIEHKTFELSAAAACYISKNISKWWKPSNDPIKNLMKAGALIAAEIDRLNNE